MGKDKSESIGQKVEFTNQCHKDYKKLKRSQPGLLTAVNLTIDEIVKDPETGKELFTDLRGFRSVHIDEFCFRIVYRVEGHRVLVHAIRHRKDVYKEMSRRIR